MNDWRLIFFVFIMLLCLQCKNQKVTNSGNEIISYLNNGYQCEYNLDSTYFYCLPNDVNSQGLKNLIVFKPIDNSIVYEENLSNPKVMWIGLYELEISRNLGIIGENNGVEKFILNILTHKRKIIINESQIR